MRAGGTCSTLHCVPTMLLVTRGYRAFTIPSLLLFLEHFYRARKIYAKQFLSGLSMQPALSSNLPPSLSSRHNPSSTLKSLDWRVQSLSFQKLSKTVSPASSHGSPQKLPPSVLHP